jgi:hypothetical protein
MTLRQDLCQAREGSLSPDVGEDHLVGLRRLAGTASRDLNAPRRWQQVVSRALESAFADRPTRALDPAPQARPAPWATADYGLPGLAFASRINIINLWIWANG